MKTNPNVTTAIIIVLLTPAAFTFGLWLGPQVSVEVPLLILLFGIGLLVALRLVAIKMKGIK